MIAAENDRKLVRFKYRFNFSRELFARVADLADVFEFHAFFRKNLRPLETHVAEIAHGVTEPRDALRQTRDTQRRRSDVHAGHARAIAERHTENSYSLFLVAAHAKPSVPLCHCGLLLLTTNWSQRHRGTETPNQNLY